MTARSCSGWRCSTGTVCLVALVAAVFGPTVGFDFVNWDDPIHITANPAFCPLTLAGIARLWTAPYEGLFIPVGYMVFALESLVGRLVVNAATHEPPAAVFHAVSVMIHAANTLLVGRLLRAVGVTSAVAVGAGAAVFAVHPLQVESVAWVSEQRGLVAACFTLMSLGMWLRGSEPTMARGLARWHLLAATACFIAAILAKPNAVVTPLMALCLDQARPRPVAASWSTCGAVSLLAVWALLALPIVMLTAGQQPPGSAGTAVAIGMRPLVAADALAFYGKKLLLPWGLCIDYGRSPGTLFADRQAFMRAGAVTMVGVMVGFVPRLAGARIPLTLFVVALLPVLGLVPFSYQYFSTVADRYVYVAMLGPALLVSRIVSVSERIRFARLGRACVAVVLGSLALLSFSQTASWRDSRSLNERALAINPRSFVAACNRGADLARHGPTTEAIASFAESVRLKPDFPVARYNLARNLHAAGRVDASLEHYETAIKLHPGWDIAHNAYGIALAEVGRIDEALRQFQLAIRANPELVEARLNAEEAERRQPR